MSEAAIVEAEAAATAKVLNCRAQVGANTVAKGQGE
jgi:hypothetical protein